MTLAEYLDGEAPGPGGGACARPPAGSPVRRSSLGRAERDPPAPKGAARGLSIRDRALAPPCASAGDTARQSVRAQAPPPDPGVNEFRESH